MLIENLEAWNRIVRSGKGYIYNDFGTQFPGDSPTWNTRTFNKLHQCSCSQVKKMTYTTEGKVTKYFFNSLREAEQWLEKNRKIEGYTYCVMCKPGSPTAG